MYKELFKFFYLLLQISFISFSLSSCDPKETPPPIQAQAQAEESLGQTAENESSLSESGEQKAAVIDDVDESNTSAVRNPLIKSDDIVQGNKDAKIVVIEYFSPTCPHCVYYHNKILPQLKEKYIDSNKILYVSREFIANKQDLDGAILARCQGNTKSYNNFVHILLNQQSKWAFNKNYREILTNLGMLGGIKAEQYAQCLQDKTLISSLMQNTKFIASQPKFIGTPAFMINNNLHLKSYSIEDLSKAIDNLLKESDS